ncbi:mechanosensitive ion channel-like protein [Roseateles asaccharophilus]|uniref:Mechanosensitive ion channel-like protein n=2 Tax=Roseateles asaccharophilus TaxID=582607 RepID=A0A4V3CK17_9BURK|nr:mechanosensitive ion channel domain-containing protein [Roseateles asaccharophilus]TDP11906.1 mechanosensitive ion channel-like protein [Roseateles asaccharophilus]
MNQPVMTINELLALGRNFFKPAVLTELGLLVACLGLAWLLVRLIQPRLASQQLKHSVLFGHHVVDGALFPGLALLLALGAKRLLPWLELSPALFKLALPVLMSLLVIRLTARVLRAALPEANWVKVVERSVSWMAWGASVLWITGLLPEILDEMESIRWKIGASQVSLRALLEGGLTAVLVMMLALWLSAVIEARLLRDVTSDLSLRKIGVNITRALLLFAGLLFALSAAGIDLTALSVLGGGLGVGIGLGMQKLAANYVSGFVILAERSLRIGDMVRVDNFEGRISDIKTRYTVIRALGGREAVVPNETLITTRVENLSLTDPRVLLSTVVQVAYGSDVESLMPLMVERVLQVPRVLADPAPSVQLSNFAADGLELTVLFWIADPENGQGGPRSDVNLALLRLLNERGVEIPFPQRVVRSVQG